jgi:hypothetical protein
MCNNASMTDDHTPMTDGAMNSAIQAALDVLQKGAQAHAVSMSDLMAVLHAHPDYVFGAVWVREDIYRALEGESKSSHLVSNSTIDIAREALREYIFDNVVYTWPEAVQEALRAA